MKINGLNINNLLDLSLNKGIKGYINAFKVDLKLPKRELNKNNLDSKNISGLESNKTVTSYKAFFDIDENKNVVIKVVDSEGNLVRQIPPEEYLKVAESLKNISKKLLHLEV